MKSPSVRLPAAPRDREKGVEKWRPVFQTDSPVGSVRRFSLDDFQSTVRYSSAHDLNFATAFAIGRELGYDIPEDIRIYGIEVKELRRFSEGCTPELQEKLDTITQQIANDLRAAITTTSAACPSE